MRPPQQQPRSRFFRRCCPRRANGSAGAKFKRPETPLLLAGALGGPFCICILTPLRNAITLGSQDAESTARALYRSVFDGGFSHGWIGASAAVPASCPQWCVMGPLYHFLNGIMGNLLAVPLTALIETFITFGSQALNAQMAYNYEQEVAGTGLEAPEFHPWAPWGPGATANFLRNIIALSGIRIFSGPCQRLLKRGLASLGASSSVPDSLQKFLGDFIASMGAAICSAPMNQCFNFAVTSIEYIAAGSTAMRLELMADFLSRSYLAHGPSGEVIGLSGTLVRDLGMRVAYMATLYTLFGSIERFSVAAWRHMHGKPSES